MAKQAFWQALIFTVLVFGAGLLLGVFLENSRADNAKLNLLNSEINILDDQVREKIIDDFGVSCELSKDSMFSFADKIYDEAVLLEAYEGSSQFKEESFLVLHKRYDLLRTLLWTEALNLKNDCENDFHTVVYLYEYSPEDVNTDAKQKFFSKLLFDLKEAHPDEVLLIPIAVNTGLSSVDLVVESYDIDKLPVILVDEDERVDEVVTLEELEVIVF